MNRFPSLLLLAAALTFALPVSAQPPGGGMGMRDDQPRSGQQMKQMMDKLAARIGLTDKQRQQIDAMHKKLRDDMQALRREKRQNQQALMQLDPESKGYQAESRKLAKKAGALTEKMLMMRASHRTEFYGVLTSEQKTRLKAWQQERQGRKNKGKGGKQPM